MLKIWDQKVKGLPAPAPLELVGLGSNPGEVESFSKFDGW